MTIFNLNLWVGLLPPEALDNLSIADSSADASLLRLSGIKSSHVKVGLYILYYGKFGLGKNGGGGKKMKDFYKRVSYS